MYDKPPVRIFFPNDLADALRIKAQYQHVHACAGGTWLSSKSESERILLPEHCLSLHGLQELNRIHNADRHVEIGAMVNLQHILSRKKHPLPGIFYNALASIATPPLRSLATLGGNLCVEEQVLSLMPVLAILDAQAELRSQSGSHWLPLSKFRIKDKKSPIAPDELLTRIRMPFASWHSQFFSRVPPQPLSPSRRAISLAILAQCSHQSITDFRFAAAGSAPYLIKHDELESELIGRRISLSKKELDTILSPFSDRLRDEPLGLTPFQQHVIVRSLEHFLQSLHS